MKNPYLIGIDGGGTSTKGYISTVDGAILADETAEACNVLVVGAEKAFSILENLINALCEKASINTQSISSMVLGIAGAGNEKMKSKIANHFQRVLPNAKIKVFEDFMIALVGAHGSKYGGLLIAGTGSVAVGVDKTGSGIRVGGNGHLVDDFGSGYDLGRQAVTKVLEMLDGRIQTTSLFDSFSNRNFSNRDSIIDYIYHQTKSKKRIASFSKEVFEAYYKDDIIAKEIVYSGANSLSTLVKTLIKKSGNDTFPIAYHGSLLEQISEYRQLIEKIVQKEYAHFELHAPKQNAIHGALICAKNIL